MRFMAVLSSWDEVWDAAAGRDVRADELPGEGAADAGASLTDAEGRARVAAAAVSVAPVRGVVELRLVAISGLLVRVAQATASSG